MDKRLTELLALRTAMKKKKPTFIRQDSNRMSPKNKDKWRMPKGLQSKMRWNLRGYPRTVEPGWGSPSEVRGLHKSGLKMVLVCSMTDLSKIDPKTDGIIISGKMGARKTLEIINEAKKKSITILNLKPEEFVKKVDESKKKKKIAKEEKAKRKEQKKKEKPKPKVSEKTEVSEEQKKEQEKAEKDKVLRTKG